MNQRLPVDTGITFELHQAPLQVPEQVSQHREGIRQAIAQLTEEAAQPRTQPSSSVLQLIISTLSPAVREKDRILCAAWDTLGPDQRAALQVAACLSLQRTPGETQPWLAVLGQFLLPLALAGCVVTGYGGVWIALPAAAYLLWSLWRQFLHSYTDLPCIEHLEAANLKVALAMDHPGLYLEALERLEAAELAGWEALRGEVRMARPHSHRRKQLYRRLGFTRG
jgi:hypothetical protein